MTLAEFLLARVDEDETIALAAADDALDARWETSLDKRKVRTPTSYFLVADVHRNGQLEETDDGAVDHIALHDPRRVLAECEAKRRIVLRHGQHTDMDWQNIDDQTAGQWFEHQDILGLLALPYVTHPDYREEWRP
jgi:hypothetical protein